MPETTTASTLEEQFDRIYRDARAKFRKEPDWEQYYRETLGVFGSARKLFTTPEQWEAFTQSPQHAEIQQMVARLRRKSRSQISHREPTRVITVRMPASLHQALLDEADKHSTSMNKLCITKLLQMVRDDLVPKQHTAILAKQEGDEE